MKNTTNLIERRMELAKLISQSKGEEKKKLQEEYLSIKKEIHKQQYGGN